MKSKVGTLRGLAAFALAVAATTSLAEAADVNSKIASFCKGKLGKKVGDGECATLAVEAFQYAGAKRYAPYGADADYVWGREIYNLWHSGNLGGVGETNDVQKAGDVIQFRNVTLRGKAAGGGTYTKTFRHHTAVIAKPLGSNRYSVYHQNIGSKRYVIEETLNFNDLTTGEIWIYRPNANSQFHNRVKRTKC